MSSLAHAKAPSSDSWTNSGTSSQMSFITHGSGGCCGIGVHGTLRGPLLTGFQCSRIRDPTVRRCLIHARCWVESESRFMFRCSFMLQKYVSSWSFDAEKVTLRGSEARVLQPVYGSPKAATTTSGADTTLMFPQLWHALACTVRVVSAGLPAYFRKTTKVARFVHSLKAPRPMLVTDEGI